MCVCGEGAGVGRGGGEFVVGEEKYRLCGVGLG